MEKRATLWALAMVAAGAAQAQVPPDEVAAGREEYMAACAACHGEAADGNGPIAAMFRTRVPDLTGLARRNRGVFPLLDVIHVIDGRAAIRAHGNPMPIFGRRFEGDLGRAAGPYGAETIVRGRVLELALYLQSIQEDGEAGGAVTGGR